MNLVEIKQIFKLSNLIKNDRQFNRYVKLINSLPKNLSHNGDGLTERHHILPRKIFPEYIKESWNIINVDSRAHYLLHYLLFKAIKHTSCVYAFNQMRRVSKSRGILGCRLYKAVKLEFAKLISKNNTGKIPSIESKKKRSEKLSNTNTYRNIKTLELKRFIVGKEPVGWESFQIGRIRTQASKDKCSKDWKGKIWQYNPNTHEATQNHKLLPGFIAGYAPWLNENINYSYLEDLIWTTNPKTFKTLRINKGDKIPKNFVKGRLFKENNGLNKINNENKITVLDLMLKKYCLIQKDDVKKSTRYLKTFGREINNIIFVKYQNIYYSSIQNFVKINSELKFNVKINLYENFIIPKYHHNMNKKKKEFCEKYHGKTLKEIGVELITLEAYTYNKEDIWLM